MSKYQHYYDILEVPPDADQDTIKQNYRRLARIYHPDVNELPGAEEMFKQINEAYQVLSNLEHDNSIHKNSPPTLSFSTFDIKLGKIAWDHFSIVKFEITWEGSFEGYSLDIDWVGEIPKYSNDLVIEVNENKQTILVSISINAKPLNPGERHDQIKITLASIDNNTFNEQTRVHVLFDVKPPFDVIFKLDCSIPIRIGPLEQGQQNRFKAKLQNIGQPIWEHPTISWANNVPFWATEINLNPPTGRVFPLPFWFDVDTSHCANYTNPYREEIIVSIANKIVATFPVFLYVIKVPEPWIRPRKTKVNFGDLAWDTTLAFDLRIDNTGDPPKHSLSAYVKNAISNWVRVSTIEPKDLTSYPKAVRLEVDVSHLAPGDYIASLEIECGDQSFTVPITTRVGPKPELLAEQSKLKVSGNYVRQMVRVKSVGGPIPHLRLRWKKVGYWEEPPLIEDSKWPIKIILNINLEGYEEAVFANTLILDVLDNHGAPTYTLQIPIEFSVK